MRTDHYATLGLPRSANTSQIKLRFKQLAKMYHPDVSGDVKRMSAINAAYSILADPKRRFAYDRTLSVSGATATARHNYQTTAKPSDSPSGNQVFVNTKSSPYRPSTAWYTALGLSAAVLMIMIVTLTAVRNTGQTTTVINAKASAAAVITPQFTDSTPAVQTSLPAGTTSTTHITFPSGQTTTSNNGTSSSATQYQPKFNHHKSRLLYWQSH